MAKKVLATLIFLAIIIAAGFYFIRYSSKPAKAPAEPMSAQQPALPKKSQTATSAPAQQPATAASAGANPQVNNKQLQGTFSSGEGDAAAPNIQVWEVDFDGSKFSPSPLNITINDWVFFKNKSSVDMWVASNPHPTHTDYPGFDSLKAIPPGGEYRFQFTRAGNWGYHDHLSPSIGGTVDVAQ